MIESYSFGRMKIDGVTYTSDLIVFADHVSSDWFRVEGHKLHFEDIGKGIIVGTITMLPYTRSILKISLLVGRSLFARR